VETYACLVSREPSFIPIICEWKSFLNCLGRTHVPLLLYDLVHDSWLSSQDTGWYEPDFAVLCHRRLCHMLKKKCLGCSLNLNSLEHPIFLKIHNPTLTKHAAETQCHHFWCLITEEDDYFSYQKSNSLHLPYIIYLKFQLTQLWW
jgi:hypothetical protein